MDTNSDPSLVDYPIPGNDDAVKSIRIIVEAIMEAIQNGAVRRENTRTPLPFLAEPVAESYSAHLVAEAAENMEEITVTIDPRTHDGSGCFPTGKFLSRNLQFT